MALDQSALLEVLDALKVADVGDRVRQAAETIYQALIEAELTETIGAAVHERTDTRTNQRNGHRSRILSTTAGDLELRIPKLRAGSFFPSLLERRRRVDQALFAVVMEAYLHGVSTRKVDDLVKALGADTGISKSEVSRICADLDQEVGAFRDRSLADQQFPYVFLDATYCKARVNRRVVSQAVVIATGVRADGWREVLGFAVGDSEDGAFWTSFLRSLKARGLGGVQLVISDAHTGLKQAISAVLLGATWQRCRVHFLRNVLAQVPKGSAEMVAAAIRTIFAQPQAGRSRSRRACPPGTRCNASALVDDEIVVLASAGMVDSASAATFVGERLPFIPPLGRVFAAWADEARVESWLKHLASDDERADERDWLAAVRSRGLSAILRTDSWQELESARARLAADPGALAREDLHGTIRKLDHGFVALSPEVKTDIGVVRVPVFGRDGRVAMQLSVYGIPSGPEAVDAHIKRIRSGGRRATELLGGSVPSTA